MVVLSSKLRHKMTGEQQNASSPQNADNNISNSVKLKKRPVVIRANETSRAMNMQCGWKYDAKKATPNKKRERQQLGALVSRK